MVDNLSSYFQLLNFMDLDLNWKQKALVPLSPGLWYKQTENQGNYLLSILSLQLACCKSIGNALWFTFSSIKCVIQREDIFRVTFTSENLWFYDFCATLKALIDTKGILNVFSLRSAGLKTDTVQQSMAWKWCSVKINSSDARRVQ